MTTEPHRRAGDGDPHFDIAYRQMGEAYERIRRYAAALDPKVIERAFLPEEEVLGVDASAVEKPTSTDTGYAKGAAEDPPPGEDLSRMVADEE